MTQLTRISGFNLAVATSFLASCAAETAVASTNSFNSVTVNSGVPTQDALLGGAEALFNYYFPGCSFYFFVSMVALLTSSYLLLAQLFKHRSMPRFLRDDPRLMSYTITSGFVIVVLAYIGLVAVARHWRRPGWDSALVRLTHNTPEGDMVAQIHASYQFWNFAIALLRGDGAVSLVHHLFCAYLGLINSAGFGCYHLIYMGGVAELSTIVLTFMDIFKNNKYLQEAYPATNQWLRYTFCAVFLVLRVAVWWAVLYSFFSDIYAYLSEGLGDGRFTLHCYVNLIAMGALTFIQLIWARLVVLGIMKALGLIQKNSAKKKQQQDGVASASTASRRSSVSTDSTESCSTEPAETKEQLKKRR